MKYPTFGSQFEGAVSQTCWRVGGVPAAEGSCSLCTHSWEAEMNAGVQLTVSFWPVQDPSLENGVIYI